MDVRRANCLCEILIPIDFQQCRRVYRVFQWVLSCFFLHWGPKQLCQRVLRAGRHSYYSAAQTIHPSVVHTLSNARRGHRPARWQRVRLRQLLRHQRVPPPLRAAGIPPRGRLHVQHPLPHGHRQRDGPLPLPGVADQLRRQHAAARGRRPWRQRQQPRVPAVRLRGDGPPLRQLPGPARQQRPRRGLLLGPHGRHGGGLGGGGRGRVGGAVRALAAVGGGLLRGLLPGRVGRGGRHRRLPRPRRQHPGRAAAQRQDSRLCGARGPVPGLRRRRRAPVPRSPAPHHPRQPPRHPVRTRGVPLDGPRRHVPRRGGHVGTRDLLRPQRRAGGVRVGHLRHQGDHAGQRPAAGRVADLHAGQQDLGLPLLLLDPPLRDLLQRGRLHVLLQGAGHVGRVPGVDGVARGRGRRRLRLALVPLRAQPAAQHRPHPAARGQVAARAHRRVQRRVLRLLQPGDHVRLPVPGQLLPAALPGQPGAPSDHAAGCGQQHRQQRGLVRDVPLPRVDQRGRLHPPGPDAAAHQTGVPAGAGGVRVAVDGAAGELLRRGLRRVQPRRHPGRTGGHGPGLGPQQPDGLRVPRVREQPRVGRGVGAVLVDGDQLHQGHHHALPGLLQGAAAAARPDRRSRLHPGLRPGPGQRQLHVVRGGARGGAALLRRLRAQQRALRHPARRHRLPDWPGPVPQHQLHGGQQRRRLKGPRVDPPGPRRARGVGAVRRDQGRLPGHRRRQGQPAGAHLHAAAQPAGHDLLALHGGARERRCFLPALLHHRGSADARGLDPHAPVPLVPALLRRRLRRRGLRRHRRHGRLPQHRRHRGAGGLPLRLQLLRRGVHRRVPA
mmetsp:Transcript_63484/g.169842  ORF Transcript_63484/g.169842 Transcript_63484/m.169842 type:complete len:833 (-) Transcript_63484:72-2570(-)